MGSCVGPSVTGLQAGTGTFSVPPSPLTSSPHPLAQRASHSYTLLAAAPLPKDLHPSPLAGPAPPPAPRNPPQRGASQRVSWLQEALTALPGNSVPACGSRPRGQGPPELTSDAQGPSAEHEAWEGLGSRETVGGRGRWREEGRKTRHTVSLGKDGASRTAQRSLRGSAPSPGRVALAGGEPSPSHSEALSSHPEIPRSPAQVSYEEVQS